MFRPVDHSSTPSDWRRRRGWRSFVTPGWVLTAIISVAFAYIAFTVLAPWQLGKNSDTQKFNHRLEEALEHDPIGASAVLRPDGVSAGVEKEWTRVELQGKFLPDDEVLLRNRPVSSSPAFQVLTPFTTNDGITVLVNRGWIAPVGGAGVPSIAPAPASEITVTGYVRMSEAVPSTAPITDEGRRQVYGMNTSQISTVTGADLAGDYVQMDEDSVSGGAGEGLTPIPLPKLDSGPYLSYGIQWIAFGIMVPLGLAYFVWAELRERRRQRDEIAAAEAAGSEKDGLPVDETQQESTLSGSAGRAGHPQATSASGGVSQEDPDGLASAGTSRERKLADRYGQKRQRAFEDRNSREEERF